MLKAILLHSGVPEDKLTQASNILCDAMVSAGHTCITDVIHIACLLLISCFEHLQLCFFPKYGNITFLSSFLSLRAKSWPEVKWRQSSATSHCRQTAYVSTEVFELSIKTITLVVAYKHQQLSSSVASSCRHSTSTSSWRATCRTCCHSWCHSPNRRLPSASWPSRASGTWRSSRCCCIDWELNCRWFLISEVYKKSQCFLSF